MKRTISIILALVLGTCALALPINATPTESTLSDHLVTHWNFEGANPYADKAVNGLTTDDLTAGADVVPNTDGTVTVPYTAGGYLSAPGAGQCDLLNLQNKTIVVKYKATAIAESNTMMLCKTAAFEYRYQTTANLEPGIIRVRSCANGTNSAKRIIDDSSVTWQGEDEWRYLIMSFSFNTTDYTFEDNYYISSSAYPQTKSDFENIATYTEANTTKTLSKNYLSSSYDFVIGKESATDGAKGITWCFDDIKIYDKALSLDEAVSTISAPQYRAAQTTNIYKNEEEKEVFDIRFAATLDTASLDSIGFDVNAVYTGGEKNLSRNCSYLLGTLNANDNGLVKYTAQDNFNSKYIMALTVTGVDASIIKNGGQIVFEVSPRSISGDTKIALDTIYVTVSYDAEAAAEAEKIVVSSSRTAPAA